MHTVRMLTDNLVFRNQVSTIKNPESRTENAEFTSGNLEYTSNPPVEIRNRQPVNSITSGNPELTI